MKISKIVLTASFAMSFVSTAVSAAISGASPTNSGVCAAPKKVLVTVTCGATSTERVERERVYNLRTECDGYTASDSNLVPVSGGYLLNWNMQMVSPTRADFELLDVSVNVFQSSTTPHVASFMAGSFNRQSYSAETSVGGTYAGRTFYCAVRFRLP